MQEIVDKEEVKVIVSWALSETVTAVGFMSTADRVFKYYEADHKSIDHDLFEIAASTGEFRFKIINDSSVWILNESEGKEILDLFFDARMTW